MIAVATGIYDVAFTWLCRRVDDQRGYAKRDSKGERFAKEVVAAANSAELTEPFDLADKKSTERTRTLKRVIEVKISARGNACGREHCQSWTNVQLLASTD